MSRRLTLFDKVSAFGKIQSIMYEIFILVISRWDIRTVHWHEYPEHGGAGLLVDQIYGQARKSKLDLCIA